MIYLDSAATSFFRPPEVLEAVAGAMTSFGNPSRGGCGPSLLASRTVFQAREALNRLFDGDGPEQVAFTANSTESLNLAIKGLLKPGELAVSTIMEHNSVLRPLYEMEGQGAKLLLAGCDEKGRLLYEDLEEKIRRGAKLAVVTHASNVTGNRNDLRRIGKICRETGTLLIVDVSQTAGIFPISMKEDNIDVVCFTGHKSLMGPQGTGGLCVRKGVEIRPLLSGGSGILTFEKEHPSAMPVRLEAGTLNTHGIAGLLAGVRYLMEEERWKNFQEKELRLAELFYRELKDCPKFIFYGDPAGGLRVPVISLNLREEDSGEVSDWLFHEYGICTRPGGHCAPLMHEFFHTERQGMVRFSFSHGNTEEEVRRAAQILKKYKQGKAHLESRIIDNEQFWKMRHWQQMEKNGQGGNPGDPQPASAWLVNCILSKHADAMDCYPEPTVLPREPGDREEAGKLTRILPVILKKNGFKRTYSSAWWYKLKSGCAVYGVFWDAGKLNGLGDISIRRMDLLNLFWEPGVTDIQDSPHFFSTELQDREALEERYPQAKGKADRGGWTLSRYLYDDAVDTSGKVLVVDWYYHTRENGRRVLQYCKFVGENVLYTRRTTRRRRSAWRRSCTPSSSWAARAPIRA